MIIIDRISFIEKKFLKNQHSDLFYKLNDFTGKKANISPIIIKFIQMSQADFYDTRKCEKHKINSRRRGKKIKINFGIDIFSYIYVGALSSWFSGGEKAIWKCI